MMLEVAQWGWHLGSACMGVWSLRCSAVPIDVIDALHLLMSSFLLVCVVQAWQRGLARMSALMLT